jgi:hypothetical protein
MTTQFEQWYNGMVGFHINSERMLDDLFHYRPDKEDEIRLRKWMVVCWNNALEAAQNTFVHDDYYYDGGPTWDGDSYYSCNPKADIEDLKEKP